MPISKLRIDRIQYPANHANGSAIKSKWDEVINATNRTNARNEQLLAKTFTPISLWSGFSAWTASGGTIVKQDTDHYGVGVDCAAMTTDGLGGACSLSSPALSAAQDFTDSFPVLAIKVSDFSRLKNQGGFALYASSDSTFGTYTNYYQWTWPDPNAAGSTTRYVTPDGSWVLVPLPFTSLATVHGSPSRASIYQFRFRIYDTYVSGGAVDAPTVKLGMVGIGRDAISTYPNGVISIHFDDGYDNLTTAYPILESRDMRADLYLIWESLGVGGRLTVDGVNTLRAAGWGTGLHSMTIADHNSTFPTIGADATVNNLAAEIAVFDSLGWDRKHFAYPGGSWNGAIASAVMGMGIRSARTVWLDAAGVRGAETWPPVNMAQVSAFSPYSNTVAQVKAWIDIVKAQRNWGILVFHSVTSGATSQNVFNVSEFAQVIEYIATQGIPTKTTAEMIG